MPFRSPLGYNKPTVVSDGTKSCVQISFLNENPSTEDDLTLDFTFTGNDVYITYMVSDGEVIGTTRLNYDALMSLIAEGKFNV